MTLFNRGAAKKKQNMIASVLQTTLASASLESQRALRESELVQLEHERTGTRHRIAVNYSWCKSQPVRSERSKVTGQSDHLAERRCGSRQRSNCARARPPPY